MMKVGAVIQARYDSTRLPGKVLMNLPFDKKDTILNHIINRISKVKLVDEVIIATSINENDSIIEKFALDNQITCIRGDKDDVLSRFVKVIDECNLDIVIRITGDNPIVLIDVLETAIMRHIEAKSDYTRNLNLPYGTSFEIINASLLKSVSNKKYLTTSDREHVTSYIKNNRKNINILEIDHKLDCLPFRFTIDYPTDYAAMNVIFQHLHKLDYNYTLKTLVDFITENEWINKINEANYQKREYKSFNDELREGISILNNFGLKNLSSYLAKKKIR